MVLLAPSQAVSVGAIIVGGLILKWLISLGPYSGSGKPPMFGDYEAQRHWMEVTYSLPASAWYVNSSDNDLQYWGLDYPPLTAYHSWLCGYVAATYLDPRWVQLNTSRGHESYNHKLFMRYTVLIADIVIYIPAIVAIYHMNVGRSPSYGLSWLLLTLIYPGLNLIDYGHFQYNCISLGFFLWSVIFIMKDRHLVASMLFCLALNYKQMELYHALPIFCYLLSCCCSSKSELKLFKLIKIATVVVLTFVVCWLPFLQSSDVTRQVLSRLFPFARGLYEDKVSNIWCSLSVFVKLKSIFTTPQMAVICLVSTAVFLLPSLIFLLRKPSKTSYLYSLVNSALVFFLFSFQVHEKSILLAAIPICLLIPYHPKVCVWFLYISTFSMFPLLHKDGLTLQYFCMQFLYIIVIHQLQWVDEFQKASVVPLALCEKFERMILSFHPISIIGAFGLCLCHIFIIPPSNLPDIFQLLIAMFGCAHFVVFLVYFHVMQFNNSGLTKTNCSQHRKKTK